MKINKFFGVVILAPLALSFSLAHAEGMEEKIRRKKPINLISSKISFLSRYELVDSVVTNKAVYILATSQRDGSYISDPDGSRTYRKNIYLFKIDANGDAYGGTIIHLGVQHGSLSVEGNDIAIFINTKKIPESYLMDGIIFKSWDGSLRKIKKKNYDEQVMFTYKMLFENENMGWYPKILRNGSIEHLNYNGLYRYSGVNYVGSVDPSLMATEYTNHQRNHSNGILPNSNKEAVKAIAIEIGNME